jgi:hypothetical protein
MKLNALKLAVSAAIVSALSLALLTICALQLGRGVALLKLVTPIMPWYSISWQGVAIGAIYGFVEGFICLGLTAWIYNDLLVWKGIKIGSKKKPAGKKKK